MLPSWISYGLRPDTLLLHQQANIHPSLLATKKDTLRLARYVGHIWYSAACSRQATYTRLRSRARPPPPLFIAPHRIVSPPSRRMVRYDIPNLIPHLRSSNKSLYHHPPTPAPSTSTHLSLAPCRVSCRVFFLLRYGLEGRKNGSKKGLNAERKKEGNVKIMERSFTMHLLNFCLCCNLSRAPLLPAAPKCLHLRLPRLFSVSPNQCPTQRKPNQIISTWANAPPHFPPRFLVSIRMAGAST